MNTTINLVESLLVQGRNLHKLGVHQKALHLFNSLSHFRRLPEKVARETRLRLAQLYCKQRSYRRARRLLAGEVAGAPEQSHGHYLLGRAAAADVGCDPRQAFRHFRQCLKRNPDNPRYLSAFGVFALRNGREKLALRALRRAFRLAPENAVVVKRYIRALHRMHRIKEARRILKLCLFRLGKKGWFQNLLNSFQFFVLHLKQKKQRRQVTAVNRQACLLPFPAARLRVAVPEEIENVRLDGPEVLPAPRLPLSLRRPDQRHAQ